MGRNQKLKAQRKIQEIKRQKEKKERNGKIIKYGLVSFAVVVLIAIGFIGYKIYGTQEEIETIESNELNGMEKEVDKKKYDAYPEMVIDQSKKYTAIIKTNKGDITVDLDAKNVPKATNNFVFLSQKGFYDGLTFHRIIKDFMIQGGDPNGDGTGDAGYKFDDEPITKDYLPGTVAMANSGPNTNGSQFFIMTSDYSGGKLPKKYVIFGSIINGMDVVKALAETPVEASGEGSKPMEKVIINTIEIEEK